MPKNKTFINFLTSRLWIAESPYGFKPELYPLKRSEEFDFYHSQLGAKIEETQWDKKTYCLHDYTDPVNEQSYSMEQCGATPA